MLLYIFSRVSVADPRFPRGGVGGNPRVVRQLIILAIYPKKCTNWKQNWTDWGGGSSSQENKTHTKITL